TRHPHQPIPAVRHKQLLRCQNQHRRIQPAPAHASRHPPPPLLVRPPRPTTPKPYHATSTAQRRQTTMTTPTPQELCTHWEHEHVYTSEEGPRCANCGKQLTTLETLEPNERWNNTNDRKANLTIQHH